MTIKLCGQNMPASMSTRAASYVFTPGEIIATNGEGDDIQSAQGAIVVWTWAYLNPTEWDYLFTTVLAGAPSVRSAVAGNTVVYNNLRAEQTFGNAVVHRPQYKALHGTIYEQVTLLIDNLR